MHEGKRRFAEVRYFCILPEAGRNVAIALVTLFSLPDTLLLKQSSNCYWSCTQTDHIIAIDVKSIRTVVAMVPEPRMGENRFFVMWKPGQTALAGIFAGLQEEDTVES
jgi:hypothetical protein